MKKLKATVLVRVPVVMDADDPQYEAQRFLANLIQVGMDRIALDRKWTLHSSPDRGLIEIDHDG